MVSGGAEPCGHTAWLQRVCPRGIGGERVRRQPRIVPLRRLLRSTTTAPSPRQTTRIIPCPTLFTRMITFTNFASKKQGFMEDAINIAIKILTSFYN